MHEKAVLQVFAPFLGRIFISLIFVLAGFAKLFDFTGTAAMMASKGVPLPEILLVLAIVFELGGGLMVMLGWRAKLGALLLFLFVIPVTYYFHSFWGYAPQEAANQMHHFLKNLAIIGGTLYIMAFGSGAYSLDDYLKKK